MKIRRLYESEPDEFEYTPEQDTSDFRDSQEDDQEQQEQSKETSQELEKKIDRGLNSNDYDDELFTSDVQRLLNLYKAKR